MKYLFSFFKGTFEAIVLFTLIFVLFNLCISCGPTPEPETQVKIFHQTTSPLESYVQEFERATGRTINFPVMLVDDLNFRIEAESDTIVGLCQVSLRHGIRVLVGADFWYRQDDATRWTLIMHELGHCELNRDHFDDVGDGGCPLSVMRWEISGASDCVRSRERTSIDYFKELVGDESSTRP